MEATESAFREHVSSVGVPFKDEIISKVKALKIVDQKILASAVIMFLSFLGRRIEIGRRDGADQAKSNLP